MPEKKNYLEIVLRYFTHDIWDRDADIGNLGNKVSSFSRWLYLVFKGFMGDQCLVRASALAFTVTLALVPFLAVAFSIAKGFGAQDAQWLASALNMVFNSPEVTEKIQEYINNTSVKTLGWVGVAFLLVTVYSMISTIEQAFNLIWKVTKGRTPWRKFTDFFSIILICPLIIIIATSSSVTLQNLDLIKNAMEISYLGWIEGFVLKLLPIFLFWIAFTFAYSFIPNTKVKIGPAALGGVVAAVLWNLAQMAFINWVKGNNNYNLIYGSFATALLFLVWMHVSWIIVLLGAEISFALQHLKSFTKQQFVRSATLVERLKLGVAIMLLLVKPFRDGCDQPSVAELADKMVVPEEMVHELFETMARVGLVVATERDEDIFFVLHRSPDLIRITDVIDAIRGDSLVHGHMQSRFGFLNGVFKELGTSLHESEANGTLSEYADRFQPEDICNYSEESVDRNAPPSTA